MFPIIPQYLHKNSVNDHRDSYITPSQQEAPESSIFSKKYKIIVSSIIEKSCVSPNITVDELLQEHEFSLAEEIRIYSINNMIQSNANNWSWLKYVHLAEDCQSYNIELCKESSESILKIKSVRRIFPNEQLVMWFSLELLLMFQIPHLSLSNIQGEKQYICHECPFQCEMPNPLKIHIALNCGKLSKQSLWKRLEEVKLISNIPQQKYGSSENKLIPSPVPTEIEIINEEKTNSVFKPSNSAFKPYKKVPRTSIKEVAKPKIQNDKINRVYSVIPNILSSNLTINDPNQTNLLYKQAIEMETIVSNLGRFKQGHLCIYCGKVYSRKYGLKIHIRTHTGFKPLKCKYCLRPFGDPSNLNKHVRLHSEGDTPYKCDLCGKILVRKRDLERHIRSRH